MQRTLHAEGHMEKEGEAVCLQQRELSAKTLELNSFGESLLAAFGSKTEEQ